MENERKVNKEIVSMNMFDVVVHHNGYKGGDAGHGGFVGIKFKGFQNTALDITVRGGQEIKQIHHSDPGGEGMFFTQPHEFELVFRGDSERDTLIEALEFIVKELKENI